MIQVSVCIKELNVNLIRTSDGEYAVYGESGVVRSIPGSSLLNGRRYPGVVSGLDGKDRLQCPVSDMY